MKNAPATAGSGLRRVPAALIAALLAAVALLTPRAGAQASSEDSVKVRVVPALQKAMPGDTFAIAVEFAIKPGWHMWTSEAQTKSLPPGMVTFDSAVFTSVGVEATPPAAVTVAVPNIQWPAPHGVKADVGDGPQTYAVFEGRAVAFVPVSVNAGAAGQVTFKVSAGFQSCNENTCLAPATVERTVTVTVGAEKAAGLSDADVALFKDFDQSVFGKIKDNPGMAAAPMPGRAAKPIEFGLFGWDFTLDPGAAGFFPILLALAFLGGIILNFTPCVLPVIPIKIIGLSSAAAGDRRRTLLLGAAMTAGVVGFWLALGILLSTVTGFKQSNQLFQMPAFTIGVGIFIALMAVGMAGFYSVGLPQWVYAIEPKHETYLGSVIFGVMTAVLSTPCTAPLMGAAAGWAVTTDDWRTIVTVFGTIGVGMGSPYLVLSAFPQMAKRVPKSGPASDVLKQVMGLLLLAAAFYFIGAGINGLREEPTGLYWWAVGAIGTAAGLWLAWRTIKLARSAGTKAFFVAVGLAIAGISAAIPPVMTYERLPWRRYTPASFQAAMKDGEVVVLDFTAEWCLNCKTLERVVLSSDEVAPVLNERGVRLLKVDITGSNPDGTAKLAELGRATIPLIAVFSPNGREVFKSDAYTAAQIIEAVRKAQGR
jgi:thiol:disulfide interchange protein DsbD